MDIFNTDKYNRVVIIRHTQPDADALSSAYGLAQVLGEVTDTEVVVANPDNAKSYLFDRSFDLTDISFTIDSDVIINDDDLVIVVDIANMARLATTSDISLGKTVVLIDHHPLNSTDIKSDFDLSNREASSAAEIIANLCKGQVSIKAAELLLPGIITDTGGFKFGANPDKSKEVALELISLISDSGEEYLTELTSHIFTPGEVEAKLHAKVASLAEYHDDAALAIITPEIFKNIQDEFGADYASFDVLAKMAFVVVNAAKAELPNYSRAAYAVANPKGGFKVSLRDAGLGISNPVAVKFNGGGHPSASSCVADSVEGVYDIFTELSK